MLAKVYDTEINIDYNNVHGFNRYAGDMLAEYQQSIEEGLDIEKYQSLFESVAAMENGAIKTKMSDALYELVVNSEIRSDYKYNGSADANQIIISKNIIIDGNGSTIDGNGSLNQMLRIYSGKSVTLKNMIIVGFNPTAILNYGSLTLDNVTFTGSGTDAAGAGRNQSAAADRPGGTAPHGPGNYPICQ